jgi:RNA polymerase primary sigma factor
MPFYKSNSLGEQYFQDIAASKGLPSEKERALARRIQQGDEEALQELVQANLRFVVTIAKEYQELGLPLADLISIGNLGLVVAARRFDGDKGFRFISYAVWWIRQAILQALKEQAPLVRLPGHQRDTLARIRKSVSRNSYQGPAG